MKFPALTFLAFALLLTACGGGAPDPEKPGLPDRTVILTFDDATRSQLEVVVPILEEKGFGATFFVTAAWMGDPRGHLSFEEVAEIHRRGFEIGNHSWSHRGFHDPIVAADLPRELARVEEALAAAGVPKPVSFAWPGDGFGPEARAALERAGYRYARRGTMPETPPGPRAMGPVYYPPEFDPLLIPAAAVAHRSWTLSHFEAVVGRARGGLAVLLEFHGVPDPVNGELSTDPDRFREFMDYLEEGGFTVVALRDLDRFIDRPDETLDLNRNLRHPRLH